jgi:hypothetical protein
MAKKHEINVVDSIRELKEREPFEPFRIVVASGDKYTIENGGNLVEMRTQFFYVNPKTDQFVFIRMNQIVSVEQMNGRRASRRKAS